jgi:hypothetical protein
MPIYVEKTLGALRRLNRPPRYIAAYRARGLRGSDGAREWDEPEAVAGDALHRPTRGRVSTIREVPSGYAADLAEIDAEREQLNARLAELRREEAKVLELAYVAGVPLSVAEVKALTAAADAERAARKVEG